MERFAINKSPIDRRDYENMQTILLGVLFCWLVITPEI